MKKLLLSVLMLSAGTVFAASARLIEIVRPIKRAAGAAAEAGN